MARGVALADALPERSIAVATSGGRRRGETRSVTAGSLLVMACALSGCGSNSTPLSTPAHLEQKATLSEWPLGALQGSIVVEDGCLKLRPANGGPAYSLLLPHGYRVAVHGGNRIDVLARDGSRWASSAMTKEIGGGEITDRSHLAALAVAPLPEACAMPVWLVLPESSQRGLPPSSTP